MHFYSRNGRLPPNGPDPVPPVNRIAALSRQRFGLWPDLAREEFLPQSVRSEIGLGERTETNDEAGPARSMGEGDSRQLTDPYPVSAEDIRLHAWLVERLTLLHHERYGLWPRIRRFLFGSRPIRWLVRHNIGENDRLQKTRSDILSVLGDRSMDAALFHTTRFRPY